MLLHRPDAELKRLTPRNKDALLFDDVLWVKRARQEHDAFADALAERGVEVLYLAATCSPRRSRSRGPRRGRSTRTVAAAALGPAARAGSCATGSHGRTPTSWPSWLIGGMALRRAAVRASALAGAGRRARTASCSPPLPNHLFTRDTSAWIYDGVSVNAMAKPARRREARPPRGDLPPPPAVRRRAHERWSDGLGGPAELEGGDILVIGNGACSSAWASARARPPSSCSPSGCSPPARRRA